MSARVEDRVVAWAMSSVLASGRLPGRSGRVARGLLGGIWLGLLGEDRLRALDERYYARDPTYRSDEWNQRGLSAWEQEAVDRAFAPGTRIVVPACGGGREVLALLGQGFDAVGYESHPALVAYAERFLSAQGWANRAWPSPRDRFPAAEACDGVLVGWGAYSLIGDRARRLEFLRGATTALRPRGPIVLSCFESAGEGGSRELRLIHRAANLLRAVRRAPGIEPGDALAPNRVHVFDRRELVSELDEAGFMVDATRELEQVEPAIHYLCVTARCR